MSVDPQWFVMQGEEQLGPYTGELLVQYASEGNITRDTLVWTEGMAEWLPAGQIEGVFPSVDSIPSATDSTPPAAAFDTAVAPAFGTPAPASAETPYPSPRVKNTGMGLWLALFLGGIALVVIGLLLVGMTASTVETMPDGSAPEITNGQLGGLGIASMLMMLGFLLFTLNVIPVYIALYRAWACVQPGGLARSTPGKAIGFLFIPFFNLYWIFQAFYGLAKDWNQTVSHYQDLKACPRLSEGVFLTFCIGAFIPGLNLVMIFPVMSQMTKGINFFAFRPDPSHHALEGATGGINIGGGFTIR
ncbi:MAG: DUF4339 domain-containing protein [Verrucomicrobiales bacterium]